MSVGGHQTWWNQQLEAHSAGACTFVHGRRLCTQLINGSLLVPLLWPAGSEMSPSTFSFNFSLSAFGRVAVVFAFGKMLKLVSHIGLMSFEDGVREEKWIFVSVFTLETVCAHHTEYKWRTFFHLGKTWHCKTEEAGAIKKGNWLWCCCRQYVLTASNVLMWYCLMQCFMLWNGGVLFTVITLCLPSLYVVHTKGANFVLFCFCTKVLPVYIYVNRIFGLTFLKLMLHWEALNHLMCIFIPPFFKWDLSFIVFNISAVSFTFNSNEGKCFNLGSLNISAV